MPSLLQTIILFTTWILMWSTGSIFMSLGSRQLWPFSVSFKFFLEMFTNPYILISYILYFIPALLWTYLLWKYPVSFVQPILALTYVLTPIFGIFILRQQVPPMRWLWIAVIIIWVIIVWITWKK